MNRKGFFIVFEGPDKSGKTTQANILKDYLKNKGFNVILTREPGGTQTAEKIRDIILNPHNKMANMCELLLYEAARADHVENLIKPALSDGYIVISDRFTLATVVYQGYARKLGRKIVENLNKIAIGGVKIDLIFGFDISVDEYYLRSAKYEKDRIEMENRDFIENVIKSYRRIYKSYKNIKVIDASKPVDEISRIIIKEVEKKIL